MEGEILYASPSVESILGYTVREFMGRQILDLVHPDDRRATIEAMSRRRASSGVEPNRVVVRSQAGDGTWIWAETVSRSVLDPQTLTPDRGPELYSQRHRSSHGRGPAPPERGSLPVCAQLVARRSSLVARRSWPWPLSTTTIATVVNAAMGRLLDAEPGGLKGADWRSWVAASDRPLVAELANLGWSPRAPSWHRTAGARPVALGLTVVGEGVESKKQATALAAMGLPARTGVSIRWRQRRRGAPGEQHAPALALVQ